MTPLRILVVDRSHEQAKMLISELNRMGYSTSFHLVKTAQDMSNALDGTNWDIVIASYSLPGFNGLQALRLLRGSGSDIPLVVIFEEANNEAAAAIKRGVEHWVLRRDLARLVPVVRRILKQKRTDHERDDLDTVQANQVSEYTHVPDDTSYFFSAVFQGSQDIMFIKDRERRLTHINPAMERICGICAKEFIGLLEEDVFGSDNSTFIQNLDDRVLTGETVERSYTTVLNERLATVNEVRVPVRGEDGEIVGLCGIVRVVERVQCTSPKSVDSVSIEAYPSEVMRSVLRKLSIAAERETTILLTGESGSGKDFLARYIHDHSRRANGPYFAINCAAVPPELAESELFGHERGAFTSAHSRKRGLLELAEAGTLLLNEIGELSLALQSKLLTFLDTRQITRVGGEKHIPVSARIIAATNRDLEVEMAAGRFRHDLFYRLNVISIVVPPLRERREDIPIVVKQIMSRLQVEMESPRVPAITHEAMTTLMNYSWPGNVRELRNVLERALMAAGHEEIGPETLALRRDNEEWSVTIAFPKNTSLNDVVKHIKASLVHEALRRSGGRREEAARLLGMSRHSLKYHAKSLDVGGD